MLHTIHGCFTAPNFPPIEWLDLSVLHILSIEWLYTGLCGQSPEKMSLFVRAPYPVYSSVNSETDYGLIRAPYPVYTSVIQGQIMNLSVLHILSIE